MPWQTVPSLLIIGGAFNVAAALMLGCDYLAYGKVRFHNTYSFVAGCWWVDSVRLASVLDLVGYNEILYRCILSALEFLSLVFLIFVPLYVIVIILLASADKFLIHYDEIFAEMKEDQISILSSTYFTLLSVYSCSWPIHLFFIFLGGAITTIEEIYWT